MDNSPSSTVIVKDCQRSSCSSSPFVTKNRRQEQNSTNGFVLGPTSALLSLAYHSLLEVRRGIPRFFED